MILGELKHFARYCQPGSLLEEAFRYLLVERPWEEGRFEIRGESIVALPQSYQTKVPGECRFEAHRRYLDIQYVVEGAEAMGWHPMAELAVAEAYSAERDVAFFHPPAQPQRVIVPAGYFTVFYPEDAHAPCQRIGSESVFVRKIVMKVEVS
jgi:YhcH/YjgK/YiaL family protein